ncbi:MAG: hypothetical protein J0M18_13105 [Ignavibacteria bacterium]|nr:hypothetical protein [Ignavibacteria bacterium]
MKTKIFPVVFLMMLLLSVNVFAQDGNDKIVSKAAAKSESMKAQFGLSDEQTKSLNDLFVSTMQKENALWKSGKTRMEMEASKDEIHADFVAGVKKIFTADQFAQFDKPQTSAGIKEGAKWRSEKMKADLDLTKKQTKAVYNLIVSTTKKQNKLQAKAKDKTELYEGRIKLDDEFYSKIEKILTADQFEKFSKEHY